MRKQIDFNLETLTTNPDLRAYLITVNKVAKVLKVMVPKASKKRLNLGTQIIATAGGMLPSGIQFVKKPDESLLQDQFNGLLALETISPESIKQAMDRGLVEKDFVLNALRLIGLHIAPLGHTNKDMYSNQVCFGVWDFARCFQGYSKEKLPASSIDHTCKNNSVHIRPSEEPKLEKLLMPEIGMGVAEIDKQDMIDKSRVFSDYRPNVTEGKVFSTKLKEQGIITLVPDFPKLIEPVATYENIIKEQFDTNELNLGIFETDAHPLWSMLQYVILLNSADKTWRNIIPFPIVFTKVTNRSKEDMITLIAATFEKLMSTEDYKYIITFDETMKLMTICTHHNQWSSVHNSVSVFLTNQVINISFNGFTDVLNNMSLIDMRLIKWAFNALSQKRTFIPHIRYYASVNPLFDNVLDLTIKQIEKDIKNKILANSKGVEEDVFETRENTR